MFGKKVFGGGYPPPPQESPHPPQQRLRASFGGRRGEDVISRRLDRHDPVPTPEEKSAALEAIVQAVRTAQELGASPYEVDSAVRGFNVAVTRNAQRGQDNGGLLPEEAHRPDSQGYEAGPDPRGYGR